MNQRKVALITGSATGVGRACAIRFAKLGYVVVVNYSRSESEANETVAEIEKIGSPVQLIRANVGNDLEVREMVQQCVETFGGLDLLVNNAGTTHFIEHTNLEAVTESIWDEIFQVNAKGTFFCCRAAMPFLKQRNGNIVNISSVAGLQGHGSSIPYAASKAAINCMTQSLARAFAPEVRVNAVAPGPILTRWLADHQSMMDKSLAVTPMKRASTPDDIADVVVFLASETNLITGQVLVIDGGRTM